MAWSTETDPDTGLRKYRLENFPSEAATREAGFNVTHKGQCGGICRQMIVCEIWSSVCQCDIFWVVGNCFWTTKTCPRLVPKFCFVRWQSPNSKTDCSNFSYNFSRTFKLTIFFLPACSSLQDLGVYISRNLTESTRYCGFLGIISADAQRNCLKKLGFSDMCASIWEFNIQVRR